MNRNLSEFHAYAGKPELHPFSKDLKTFIDQNNALLSVLNNSASFFFILDFAAMKYIYVSEGIINVMGYTSKEWMEEGINAAYRTLHPEDGPRLNKILQDQFAHLHAVPLSRRMEYKYAKDFRVHRKDGNLIWILAQDSFVSLDQQGKPSIGFEVCTDVTHLKHNNVSTLTISSRDAAGVLKSERKYYYPLDGNPSFTSREIEILQLLHNGYKSKAIGDKLSISELTVYKHRRNMLKKVNAENTQALINYALKNALI